MGYIFYCLKNSKSTSQIFYQDSIYNNDIGLVDLVQICFR